MGKAKGGTKRYGAGFKWQKTDKKQHRAFKKRFLTLSQAAERLMVDRKILRRIVVFKGFYPIKPKSYDHGSGKDKTYYSAPALMSLEKDPLLQQLRAYEVWRKKMTKYIAKEQTLKARILKQKKPVINFVPIVKERFPMFADALKALDDALSHVALFSILPPQSAASTNIEPHKFLTMRQHQQCQELIDKWNNFIVRSHALRKVFFTIKGIYFQAEVSGETVTWLCPYEFTTTLPKPVDYSVMIAFLEYYLVHLGFVVFKLHHDLQKQERDEESKPEVADATTEDFPRTPEEQAKRDELVRCRTLFNRLTFFLQRETPVKNLALMIQSFGGTVAASAEDPTITHQVVDRPKESVDMSNKARDYVQPQWVADCCNAGRLLPVDNYAPGATLPPHLSPFPAARYGNDYDPSNPYAGEEDEGKRPLQLSDSEDEAERRAQETPSEDDDSVLTDNDYGDKDELEEGEEPAEGAAAEGAEQAGEKPKKKGKQQRGFSEMGLRMQMMHKRERRLYKAIKGREIQQKEKVKHYVDRRRAIDTGNLKVHPSGKMLIRKDQEKAPKRPRPNPKKSSA